MTTISRSADTPSAPPADPLTGADAALSLEGDQKARDRVVAAKRVATIARNKEAERAERLADMARQVSDGSLVIRQMTAAERSTGSKRG
ncbi:MAG: hypothetical protein ACRDNK_24490 [Solirubrobacteraceae bacterium]